MKREDDGVDSLGKGLVRFVKKILDPPQKHTKTERGDRARDHSQPANRWLWSVRGFWTVLLVPAGIFVLGYMFWFRIVRHLVESNVAWVFLAYLGLAAFAAVGPAVPVWALFLFYWSGMIARNPELSPEVRFAPIAALMMASAQFVLLVVRG